MPDTLDAVDTQLITEFTAYVRAGHQDSEFVRMCLQSAHDMLDAHIGPAKARVSESTYTQALVVTAANLFARRANTTDIGQFANGLTQAIPARPTLDPLHAARQILAAELGPGIA